ncbi:MAG: hypothetical protein K2K83_03170 [Rikenella sp.]|nr:hypothetical protein [Rikenella sp.]
MYGVGYGGFSWSSSVTTGAGAYYLGFNYGAVGPNDGNGRANGLQLRCLQE